MIFKQDDCKDQLAQSPDKLQEIANYFDELSNSYGIESVVTRVWDAVCGDSGVHEDHRAVDFRDQTIDGMNVSHSLYTAQQVQDIVKAINTRYPRDDGKLVCIHHSFHGAPFHFHLQISVSWV